MIKKLTARELQILEIAISHPPDLPRNLWYLEWDKDSKPVQRLLDKIRDMRDWKECYPLEKTNVFVLNTIKDKSDLKEII